MVAKGACRAGAWLASLKFRARIDQPAYQPATQRSRRLTRVLLVDDHPMIGAALDMLLRGSSYELLGRARTVAEANREISRQKPDLLLLDVNLPDGTGVDVLRRVSRSRARPKVILLTAGMDESQLLAAADLNPEGMV